MNKRIKSEATPIVTMTVVIGGPGWYLTGDPAMVLWALVGGLFSSCVITLAGTVHRFVERRRDR